VDSSAGAETRCLATLADQTGDLVQGLSGAAKGGEGSAQLPAAVTRACLDELAAAGADLSKINTEQNARDVQAVMRALGYPVFNLYGISYGTKLGLEVMRTAPDGVRAAVLDSVAPPQVPTYDTLALPHAESIGAIFTLCAADAACAAAYPNLKARFWALFSRLSAAPITAAGGKIDGDALFMLVASRNAHKLKLQGLTGYIPRMVAELEQGVTTRFDAIVQDQLPRARPRRPRWPASPGWMRTPSPSRRRRSSSPSRARSKRRR
jgi:pimeloyl-ACP methyl ester carboxylesterase